MATALTRDLANSTRRAKAILPRLFSRSATIASATTQVVNFIAPQGREEGLLFGLGYRVGGDDYPTNPGSLVIFSPSLVDYSTIASGNIRDTAGNPLQGQIIQGLNAFTARLSAWPDGDIFRFPNGWEYAIQQGYAVGLQIVNGSGAPLAVDSIMSGSLWPVVEDGQRDRDGPPFGERVFS